MLATKTVNGTWSTLGSQMAMVTSISISSDGDTNDNVLISSAVQWLFSVSDVYQRILTVVIVSTVVECEEFTVMSVLRGPTG